MTEEQDTTLHKLSIWKAESWNLTQNYITQWAKNDRMWKGVFEGDVNKKSTVRNVKKMFFRKIWATGWRLLASFYNAYLRDYDNFKIEGRDTFEDPRKARVIQFMAQYHRDRMYRQENLFLKFVWSFQNIIKFGLCVGKFYWNVKKDKPDFCLYPNDQAFLDLAADETTKMRYAIFLNYMTKEDMESYGYQNIDQCEISSVEDNELRNTRFYEKGDPLQFDGRTDYTSWVTGGNLGGSYSNTTRGDGRDAQVQRYHVYECFWKEGDLIFYGVSCNFKFWLMEPVLSPYGERFPVVVGTCLTEPHKIIGEGFPEPLEAPQESYNYNLNIRKDNVALAMTGHTFVSRYGNVDLQSLINRRAGGYTQMDDVNAVKHESMPDVTQASYMESNADALMMDEMSGITPGKQGLENTDKATVAQINFTESNAKVDLYIAIVGETFMRDWVSMLAYLISKFESDVKVFRVANEKLQKEYPESDFVYDIDIETDCIVNVGTGTAGRDMEIKQILLAMDRAMMANQATGQLLQIGALNAQNAMFINTAEFMVDLLPKMGQKDLGRYFIKAQQPTGKEGTSLNGGASQPQVGDMTMPADANLIQAGSMGGI